MKRNIFYILIIIAFSIGLYFLINTPLKTQVKCSENFPNTDAGDKERLATLDKWTNDFYGKHPGATLSDWSNARYNFWVDNNCIVAIEQSKKSGKVTDPKTWELIDHEIQNVLQDTVSSLYYDSELGFSFNYPDSMFVTRYPDAPRLAIIPNSYKVDTEQDMTAIIISAMLNDPLMTPLEWLEGPNSGADLSKGYSKLEIDGQEAISIKEGTWIVVNTPDDKRQLSIVVLPSGDGGNTLFPDMKLIINSLTFAR